MKTKNSTFDIQYSIFESGQTLIETVVALFILTTGLTAGLTLAIYLSSSTAVTNNKVIGSALAREGIEGVRRLRDSNWLAGSITDCGGQLCYSTWLSDPARPEYTLLGAGGSGIDYLLMFDPTAVGNKWTLAIPAGDFRLYTYTGTGGYFGYLHDSSNSQPSQFFRKVNILYTDTNPPYDANFSPLVSVRSTVWWWDKNCPQELNNPVNTTCKVVAEEYLSNWKNY